MYLEWLIVSTKHVPAANVNPKFQIHSEVVDRLLFQGGLLE